MKLNATELEKRVINEYLQQYNSIHKFPKFNEITVKNRGNKINIETDDNFHFEIKNPETFNILTDERERLIFYNFFQNYFNKDLNWGILSGVKPVKLYRKIERLGLNAEKILEKNFYLNPEKVKILKEINEIQRPYLNQFSNSNHISLYLGIPICPARCSYCSFVSTVLDKKRILLTDYLKQLKLEITETAKIVRQNNLIIDTVYIGGGTPSVLNSLEASDLLNQLSNEFDLRNLKEFTFEAGRPETTTKELLTVLKDKGINRICLNPQTMNQETLYSINRNHTVQDITDKYSLIKDLGFDNVNMDLIVGLNNESEADFNNSLDQVIQLAPENLTVHDLSIKRGSYLNEINGKNVNNSYTENFFKSIENNLKENNYIPYYLYRQKYTIGNGENIGYSKPGKEGIYNILMMAEEQTILGIGAGSSGKLYNQNTDRFSHVFTVKDIRTYNQRAPEIIQRKIKDYKSFFEERKWKN